MQVTNFCRALSKTLDDALKIPSHLFDIGRLNLIHEAKSLCASSQKFIIPDDDVMFQDIRYRALNEDQPLRLPYKQIAIEYRLFNDSPGKAEADRCGASGAAKCIVFAWEDESNIFVRRYILGEAQSGWTVCSLSAIPKHGGVLADTEEGRLIKADVVKQGYLESLDEKCDLGAVAAVLALLNVLACSNIKVKAVGPKSGGRKVKSALQFDTYHVLMVESPCSPAVCATGSREHRSPREHLRRGHIRRLDGGRSVWVNAAVVAGGRGAGVVSKAYAVRKAI